MTFITSQIHDAAHFGVEDAMWLAAQATASDCSPHHPNVLPNPEDIFSAMQIPYNPSPFMTMAPMGNSMHPSFSQPIQMPMPQLQVQNGHVGEIRHHRISKGGNNGVIGPANVRQHTPILAAPSQQPLQTQSQNAAGLQYSAAVCDISPSNKAMAKKSGIPANHMALTTQWLTENFETCDSRISISREKFFNHYTDFAHSTSQQLMNQASFGKLLRSLFKLTTRRLGVRGQSKYHYSGIRIRESSHLKYAAKDIQVESSDFRYIGSSAKDESRKEKAKGKCKGKDAAMQADEQSQSQSQRSASPAASSSQRPVKTPSRSRSAAGQTPISETHSMSQFTTALPPPLPYHRPLRPNETQCDQTSILTTAPLSGLPSTIGHSQSTGFALAPMPGFDTVAGFPSYAGLSEPTGLIPTSVDATTGSNSSAEINMMTGFSTSTMGYNANVMADAMSGNSPLAGTSLPGIDPMAVFTSMTGLPYPNNPVTLPQVPSLAPLAPMDPSGPPAFKKPKKRTRKRTTRRRKQKKTHPRPLPVPSLYANNQLLIPTPPITRGWVRQPPNVVQDMAGFQGRYHSYNQGLLNELFAGQPGNIPFLIESFWETTLKLPCHIWNEDMVWDLTMSEITFYSALLNDLERQKFVPVTGPRDRLSYFVENISSWMERYYKDDVPQYVRNVRKAAAAGLATAFKSADWLASLGNRMELAINNEQTYAAMLREWQALDFASIKKAVRHAVRTSAEPGSSTASAGRSKAQTDCRALPKTGDKKTANDNRRRRRRMNTNDASNRPSKKSYVIDNPAVNHRDNDLNFYLPTVSQEFSQSQLPHVAVPHSRLVDTLGLGDTPPAEVTMQDVETHPTGDPPSLVELFGSTAGMTENDSGNETDADGDAEEARSESCIPQVDKVRIVEFLLDAVERMIGEAIRNRSPLIQYQNIVDHVLAKCLPETDTPRTKEWTKRRTDEITSQLAIIMQHIARQMAWMPDVDLDLWNTVSAFLDALVHDRIQRRCFEKHSISWLRTQTTAEIATMLNPTLIGALEDATFFDCVQASAEEARVQSQQWIPQPKPEMYPDLQTILASIPEQTIENLGITENLNPPHQFESTGGGEPFAFPDGACPDEPPAEPMPPPKVVLPGFLTTEDPLLCSSVSPIRDHDDMDLSLSASDGSISSNPFVFGNGPAPPSSEISMTMGTDILGVNPDEDILGKALMYPDFTFQSMNDDPMNGGGLLGLEAIGNTYAGSQCNSHGNAHTMSRTLNMSDDFWN